MQSIKNILQTRDPKKVAYSKYEFQEFGLRIAKTLNDFEHKSLYIRLAKKEERNLLLDCLEFVKGAYRVKNPAKLFMWKLASLRKEKLPTKTK